MPFSIAWSDPLEVADDLPASATPITALSHDRFRITDTQDHRIIIEFVESGESKPLQREQFETLYHHIEDAPEGFDRDRLPPDADPYPTLTLYPRYGIDEEAGVITKTDASTPATQLLGPRVILPRRVSESSPVRSTAMFSC